MVIYDSIRYFPFGISDNQKLNVMEKTETN